jgi:hypothetical protein
MTDQISFPPLLDLPPVELATRREHLLSEIAREPHRARLSLPALIFPRPRLLRPAVAVLVAAIGVLAAVPVGGASLGSRAINGISSLWGTPASQPHLDAVADQARKIAGSYYTSAIVHNDTNKVDVYLARAPRAVISQLEALHPTIYVIHNDAPHRLSSLTQLANSLDVKALKAEGIDVVQWGPTPDGYLQVGVTSDVATAQAKLDAMYGTGIIRVFKAQPASSLMPHTSTSG